jgi:hypothetical protein
MAVLLANSGSAGTNSLVDVVVARSRSSGLAGELGSSIGGSQTNGLDLTHHAQASVTLFDTENKDFEQKLCDVIQVNIEDLTIGMPRIGVNPAQQQLLVWSICAEPDHIGIQGRRCRAAV